MKKQIPNILTILRFLLVPVFLYFLFASPADKRILVSLIIFIIASITDYFDGLLARRLNLISDFGKIMDPLADKFLVISALAGLCWLHPFKISAVIFFTIFGREVLITVLREVYQNKGIVVAADKLGKLKTVMQMAGIIFALGVWAYLNPVPQKLIMIVELWFWLVVAITLISGFNYVKVLWKRSSEHA